MVPTRMRLKLGIESPRGGILGLGAILVKHFTEKMTCPLNLLVRISSSMEGYKEMFDGGIVTVLVSS